MIFSRASAKGNLFHAGGAVGAEVAAATRGRRARTGIRDSGLSG
jgi:hypothetical protein